MDSYSTTRMIQALYEQFRGSLTEAGTGVKDWKEASNCGLYFRLRIRCDNNGYDSKEVRHPEWEVSFTTMLHFVVTASHRTYFARKDYSFPTAEVAPSEFKNISNHDSCWKDSIRDEIFRAYIDAAEACWSHVPENQRKAPAYADVSIEMAPLFLPSFHFVFVERKPLADPEESNRGYLDQLTKVYKVPAVTTLDLTKKVSLYNEEHEKAST